MYNWRGEDSPPTEIFQLFGWSRHLAAKQEKCTAKGVGFTREILKDVNPASGKGTISRAPLSTDLHGVWFRTYRRRQGGDPLPVGGQGVLL